MTLTISTLLQPLGIVQIPLNAFRDAAGAGEVLQVVHDGSGWQVWPSEISVAERFGARAEFDVDTTTAFADALGQAFSRRIQEAVVRELDLAPKPGQPLESRLVRQAITMAEASQQALQGVDFMTRLMCSASAHSGAFVAACREAELLPQAVSPLQRAEIDARMQERFSQAAQQGLFPVAPGLAQQWLRAELTALKMQAPDTH